MSRKAPTKSLILAEGIREDVLQQKLSLFFGSSASFEKTHTKDGRKAYLISSEGVKATQAMIEDLRAASRKAIENEKKSFNRTPGTQKMPQPYVRPSEQAPFPPQRHDSHTAKLDVRKYGSDRSSAFSAHDKPGMVAPRGMGMDEDLSRAVARPNFGNSEVHEEREDHYRLFPKAEDDDALQQSVQSRHPPRQDSRQPPPQDSRATYSSGAIEPQGGTGAVAVRQPQQGVQDRYQQHPESQYRSASQKRADLEARHRPDVSQPREPSLVSQSPQILYPDQHRSPQSYARSDPVPTGYLPGQAKKQSDFAEFNDWLEYRRQKEAYERERHAEPQRVKYDKHHETPPPRYSEIEPRQYKRPQPSPSGTYGYKPRQPSPDAAYDYKPRQPSSDATHGRKPRQPSPDSTHGQNHDDEPEYR